MKYLVPVLVGAIAVITISLTLNNGKTKKYLTENLSTSQEKIPLDPSELANQIILTSDLSLAVDDSIAQSIAYMKKPPYRDPVMAEQKRKEFEPILAKFEQNKEILKKSMYLRLQTDLQKKFKPQEMAEILKIVKNPITKKFLDFTKTSDYNDVMGIPSAKVQYMLESRKTK